MNEQYTLFDRLRWVIMLPKKEADKWEDTDFKLVYKGTSSFTDDYQTLLIEPLTADCQYTAEDVMDITDAIAVHEEFTNGIITTPEGVEDLGEVYCWGGAGACFLADMLTDVEKLSFLVNHLYTEKKELIEIKDIDIIVKKDGPRVPLADNLDKLFTHDIYQIAWKEEEISIWWAFVIENVGLFLAIIDDELLWEDEDDEEDVKKLPAPRDYAGYDDLYPWGSYYDDYDYDDRYYRRT